MEQRTNKQNKAMHKFFNDLAGELNAKGYDMKVVMKPDFFLKWDGDSVKENLWKPKSLKIKVCLSPLQIRRLG